MAKSIVGKRFWLEKGSLFVRSVRTSIFMSGEDVNGNAYPPYDSAYKDAKATGKLKRQATKYKDENVPILTGDLMRDFKLRKTKSDGIEIGWVAFGSRIKSLAKKGRFLTTKETPIPKFIAKRIEKEMSQWIETINKKDFKKVQELLANCEFK